MIPDNIFIKLKAILRMFPHKLRDLVLGFSRQMEEVVTPVGGGRLVHWAPHQRPRLVKTFRI